MAKLTKFSLGQSYGDLVGKLNETIDAVGEVQDNPYTLPAATSTELGGVKVGSNITNSSGTISLTKGNVTSALGYTPLQKLTYEETKELACGSNGKVCLGKFGAYDTNITIDIDSTTSTTYHATIVIHSQNVVANGTGGTVGCYVYGDADNHITPLISVFRPYGSTSRQIEVYANLPGWSKNLVHVRAVALSTGEMTDVLTSVDAIPTAINGKITVTPINVLTTAFQPKGSYAGTSTATTSAAGLMSAADKTKVDNAVTLSDAQTISGTKTFSSHIKTAENVMGTKYRTHDSYETGVVYGTSGNEALTFAIQNPVTAFQIVYGTKPSAYASGTWQSVTPLFQTKDGKVIINRKIASSTDSANLKLFDVNGDANATTLYENGTALSSKYASKSVATQASNGLMSAYDKQKLDSISSTAGSGGGIAYFATANILSDIYGFNKTYLAFGSTSSSGTNWRMAVIKTTNADEYGTGFPDLFITTSNSTSASQYYYNDGDGRYQGSVAGFGYCYIFVVQ